MIQIAGGPASWREKYHEMVQEQPATCVGIAFVVGILAGWWVKR